MYRIGSNKRPFFRIVATDERRKVNGRFLEIVGWYDPKVQGKNFDLKNDRIEYWKGKGAQVTASVASLLRRGRQAAKRA
jgi:small subunit ribosomal protein S16